MAKQVINIGSSANDKSGDPLRTAFNKVNENFTELYARAENTDSQTLSLVDNTLSISGGNSVTLSPTATWNSVTGKPSMFDIGGNVVGIASSDTITEETIGGTISQTTTIESQIEIEASNIVIAKRITQVVDDGVVVSTDSTGSQFEVTDASISIKRYVEPDGPNNSSYFQIGASNGGAILEGVQENIGSNTFGRITVTQGVVSITASVEGNDKEWVFDFNGDVYVPTGSAIRGANDLSLVSSADGNSGVFVNGNSLVGTAVLYATNNAIITADYDGNRKDWNFGTTGNITFPDTSTYGNSTLTGAVDGDLAFEVKHRTTISATEISGGSPFFTADITTNDDIIVVQPGWEVNAGTELEPIWVTILTADEFSLGIYNITPVYEEIPVGFEFVVGQSYTFRNPVPGSRTWTIRSQTGGLVGPGGVIVTNETYPLGGGGTYRELAIELPTPDGLNEQRWVFANDGDFTAPGDIFAGSFLGQALEITDAGIVSSTYVGELQTLHVAGAVGKGLSLAVNGGLTSWFYDLDGKIHLPAGGDIVDSTGTSVLDGGGGGTGILDLQAIPATNKGQAGDTKGMVAINGSELYFCGENYTDGVNPIWFKLNGSSAW